LGLKNMVTYKSWQLLSHVHIASAHLFKRNAVQIEKEYDSRRISLTRSEYNKLSFDHLAYVIGSIFSAAAFLDALINELFLEADKYVKGELDIQLDFEKSLLPPGAKLQDTLAPLPPDVLNSMASAWHSNIGLKRRRFRL